MLGQKQGTLRLDGRDVIHRVASPTSLVVAGVLSGFLLALLVVVRLGYPLWSLLLVVIPVFYAVAVARQPMIGLLTVICFFSLPIRFGGFTLLQSVGVGTAGITAVWFLHQRRAIRLGNLFIPILLLGALILLSLFYTLDVARTMAYFRVWLFNLAFYLLLVNVVTRFDDLKKVIWTVMLMAAVNATVGMTDFATSGETVYRSAGAMQNPLDLGDLAALAIPLALYRFLYASGFVKYLGLALSAIFAGGVVVSMARGSFIALMVVFGVILVVERRRSGALVLVVVLALVAAPFLPAHFYDRVDNLIGQVKGTLLLEDEEGMTIRGYYNKGGMRIWMAHPLLGVGIGNFGYYFIEREFNPGVTATTGVSTHNAYLQVLTEMGLIGFGVFMWLIGATLHNLVRARRACLGDLHRWSYIGALLMSSLTVFLASASSGGLMRENLWLALCLPAAAIAVVREERAETGSGDV
jgi:O-antigen ligase